MKGFEIIMKHFYKIIAVCLCMAMLVPAMGCGSKKEQETLLKKLEEKYQLNISEEIGEEGRNMCSYSQVIEDRGMKKGMEKGS